MLYRGERSFLFPRLPSAVFVLWAWLYMMRTVPYLLRVQAARLRLLAVLKPALGGIMWRTAKRDVAAELGVPPQRHSLVTLRLSAIERHFYQRQHQVSHYSDGALSYWSGARAFRASVCVIQCSLSGDQGGGACWKWPR